MRVQLSNAFTHNLRGSLIREVIEQGLHGTVTDVAQCLLLRDGSTQKSVCVLRLKPPSYRSGKARCQKPARALTPFSLGQKSP